MQIYDYPFSERIRYMLRIEALLKRVVDSLQTSDSSSQHLFALQSLLQLIEITDRAEIKFELIQEMVNQKQFLIKVKESTVVDNEKIIKLLTDIETVILKLQNDSSKLGHHMRTNEWLASLHNSFSIPGGICSYDMPSFEYWLSQDPAKRRLQLSNWLKPMIPMQQAVYILLHLLRSSGKTNSELAKTGLFSKHTGKETPCHMLRVYINDDMNLFPSISANKYAINIQFMQLNSDFVQEKSTIDVPFHLSLCRF